MAQPLTEILTHAADALAQLARQYQNDPLSMGAAMGVGSRAQTLETALWQIYTQTGISPNAAGFTVATGAQLDLFGKLVNQPRGALNDTDYTALLRATIKVLLCSGTIPDLIAIFSLMLPAATVGTIVVQEYFPAAIILDLTAAGVINPSVFSQVLQVAKAGGVRALLHYTLVPLANTLSFATGTDPTVGPGGFLDASSPNQCLVPTTTGAGAFSGIVPQPS